MSAPVSTSKYILYNYWRSGASWRVRIALALKCLPYESRAVNLLKSEQHDPEYVKMNPQRKVPLLIIDEKRSLSQSFAIMDYLDNAHPDTVALLPKDPFLRAKVLSLAEGFNADTQPLHNLPVLGRVEQLLGEQAKLEWGRWAIESGLQAFEAAVQETVGKYSVGDEITLADVCIPPQMATARRFKVDLTPYPTIVRIDQELALHPAFIAAHPNQQADRPEGITA